MIVDTESIVTMTEANQNFSMVARCADRNGRAVVFKNNKPRYLVVSISDGNYLDLSDDERIEVVARRIMRRHRNAFKELAK